MSTGTRLSGYVGVLRKHTLLLSTSVVLVVGAGFAYLWQQPAVYEAEALLLIEQPVPNLVGGAGSARNYFAISQAALNTELYLLRQDETMAAAAIAKARAAGIDTDAAGYTPAGLASRVSVSQVPGTEGLVRFALTGGDRATLPKMVELYAKEYRDSAVESRSEQFNLQLDELQRRVDAAEQVLQQGEKKRDDFAAEHADVNLERGENPFTERRAALAAQLPSLEQQALSDELLLRRIREALEDPGITIDHDEQGDVVLRGPGDRHALEEALAGSALVSGLLPVRQQPKIAPLSAAETEAEARDRQLEEQGLLDGHARRKAAQEAARSARAERGWLTARALEIELTDIAARAQHLASVRERLAEAEESEEALNRLLADYQQLSRDAAARLRDVEAARTKLSDFTSMFLAAPRKDDDRSEAPSNRLRIEVRAPPHGARQVAPKVPLVLGLTFAAALATGLGLVFLFEYMDDTLRSKDDFDRYVGLPFLGFVPRISSREHDNPDLAAQAAPGSVVAEAFRAVRTSILFSRVDRPVRTLLVTSAGPGEGKTTIATNLAVTFARRKGPVLLVDADLRKPRIASALGLAPGPGLANVLVGAATLADVVRPTPVEGLFAITSGPTPPNPAELLHGEQMVEFLREAAERYECVVLDTPPLIAVSDARVLASRVDGRYLVISMGRTSHRLIQRAVESLTSIGFVVDGAILNNMSSSDQSYGDYISYAREYRTDG